ncbi:MAG: FtsQ-type POTRA domain-containing protein [Bacilli bacterium]|nr:FtsQ-type POTRA domain-containing protein [Bacilli bacterium]
MAKKLVKKRKLRVFRLLLVLLILALFALGIYLFINDTTKNIIIENTEYLNDDYIIELAEIKDYPSFWLTSSKKIEKKLEKSPYIKKVKIKRRFYNVLKIEVIENRPLFMYEGDQNIVFENKEKVQLQEEIELFRIPRLMNYVPDDKYDLLIKGLKKIDKDTLGKVSEMTYNPNEYDKDRFLLYMDDGNSVYLTLTKFKMLNYYNKVLTQLEGKKGILYLDNGNHFQIKE